MKVLILNHIEEVFERLWPPGYRDAVYYQVVHGGYDLIIALCSYIEDDGPIEEIVNHAPYHARYEELDVSWGYEEGACYEWPRNTTCKCTEENSDNFEANCPWVITENTGHDAMWIHPMFRDIPEHWEIYIGGGHTLECLQDLRAVLEWVGAEYTEVEEIIY